MFMMSTIYVANIIADYIVAETFSRLPCEVTNKAKQCIQDSLACLLGAYRTPLSGIFEQYVSRISKGGGVHVLGSTATVDPATAASVGAMLFSAMDFDDIYDKGHPGATIMAAGFSVGEMVGCSGAELIVAVIVGYEVSGRIGRSLVHLKPRRAIHGHGTWQVFGATATAGKLLGLDRQQMAHALAISAANAPVASVMKTVY